LKELGWPVLQQNVPRGILAGRVEVQGWNWEGFMIRDSSVQWVRLNFIFSGQRVIKVKKKFQRRWQRVSSFNGNCLQKHFTKYSQSLLKVRRQLWKVRKLDLTSEIHYASLHITPFKRRNFGLKFWNASVKPFGLQCHCHWSISCQVKPDVDQGAGSAIRRIKYWHKD